MSDLLTNIARNAKRYAEELHGDIIATINLMDGGTFYGSDEIISTDTGYQVGETKFSMTFCPLEVEDEPTEDAINFISQAYGIFRARFESILGASKTLYYWNHYWDEDDNLTLTASVHVESMADALTMARELNETAIWDWANSEEVAA